MSFSKIYALVFVVGSLLQAGEWKFSAGGVYQLRMESTFSGHPCYERMNLHGIYPENAFAGAPIDDGDYGDREFLDGYVKKDPGTGTSGSLGAESTWYWGYNSPSQYDSSAKILLFHSDRTSSESTQYSSTIQDAGVIHEAEQFKSSGICLSGAYSLFEKGNWGVDLQLGCLANNREKWHLSSMNYLEAGTKTYTMQELQWLYTYDVGGVTMPAAGYQGTYEGPFAVPSPLASPLIPNQPTDWTPVILGNEASGTKKYSTTTDVADLRMDAQFAEIQFGGKFYYNLTERCLCYLSLNFLLAYADVSARYAERFCQINTANEVLYAREWNYKSSSSKFLSGIGYGFGAEYELTKSLFVGMSLCKKQYFSDAEMSVADSTVKLNFDCMETKFYIGWNF